MSKQFWGVIAAVIIVFVGIFALTGHKSTSSTKSGGSSNSPTQHFQGLGKDNVTLVEYGDYECPYCGQYFPIVKQVQTEFNNQIKVQFRNFPLTSIHQNAFAAARAAEAAGLQNKFWEMHDALYETQNNWASSSDPTTYFAQIAQQIGLNATQYKQDYASSKVNDLINADTAAGTKLGIQGTPTFYLDGKQVTIGQSAAAFEKVINAEIAKKAPSTGSTTSTPSATSTNTTDQTTKPY